MVNRSKQSSVQQKEVVEKELDAVKDLLQSFEHSIGNILDNPPATSIDIPLLDDVVGAATAVAGTVAPQSESIAPQNKPLPPPTDAIALQLEDADLEELEELVFADQDRSQIQTVTASLLPSLEKLGAELDLLPGGGKGMSNAASTETSPPAAELQRELGQLVDDVIEQHLPAIKSDLLLRLQALLRDQDIPI